MLTKLTTTTLIALGLLAVFASPALAAGYIPWDRNECLSQEVCDVELTVENTRGIAQNIVVIERSEHGASLSDFNNEIVNGNQIRFNFYPAAYMTENDVKVNGVWTNGPFTYPVAAGAGFTFKVQSGLQPGDTLLINRNGIVEDGAIVSSNDQTLFPEGRGIAFVVPGASYQGQIVLPSFPLPTIEPELSDLERGLLGKINDLRQANGLNRLRAAPALNAAADAYACRVSRNSTITQNPHRLVGSPFNRAIDFGWPDSGTSVGENLHGGAILGAFSWWLGSPLHRQNMLDADYKYAGVGNSCGQTALGMATGYKTLYPVGGISTDTGDSRLYKTSLGNRPNVKRRIAFRPVIRLVRARSKNPVVAIRVKSRAQGKTIIRYRGAQRKTRGKSLRLRVRGRGRIVVIFSASKKSRVKSGRATRCLQRKNGVTRISSCR